MLPVDSDNVGGLFHDFMLLMEAELNLTAVRLRRRDHTWGGYLDGEYDGMVKTIQDDEADIIATSLTQNPQRFPALDYLWPIGTETYGLFVKRITEEEIAWTVFLQPFSYDLWTGLLIHSLLAVAALQVFDWYTSKKEGQRGFFSSQGPIEFLLELFLSFWNIICTYFGKPLTHSLPTYKGRDIEHARPSVRLAFFTVIFVGSIVFMCYRASLTSELSTLKHKKPFEDLNGLLQSDYR